MVEFRFCEPTASMLSQTHTTLSPQSLAQMRVSAVYPPTGELPRGTIYNGTTHRIQYRTFRVRASARMSACRHRHGGTPPGFTYDQVIVLIQGILGGEEVIVT
jgi:hypothetical protein